MVCLPCARIWWLISVTLTRFCPAAVSLCRSGESLTMNDSALAYTARRLPVVPELSESHIDWLRSRRNLKSPQPTQSRHLNLAVKGTKAGLTQAWTGQTSSQPRSTKGTQTVPPSLWLRHFCNWENLEKHCKEWPAGNKKKKKKKRVKDQTLHSRKQ